MQLDPLMLMKATEAVNKKVGVLTCPMCGQKNGFKAGFLQTSAFTTIGYICPKCGYVIQFDLRPLLAE